MKLKALVAASAPIAIATVATGLLFYFFGNMPGLKQAQLGLNGAQTATPIF